MVQHCPALVSEEKGSNPHPTETVGSGDRDGNGQGDSWVCQPVFLDAAS